MTKIFRVLMVLAILAVAVGFYRGWFSLSTPAADTGSNKVNVELTVDPDKVKSDVKSVKELTGEQAK